MIRKEIRINHIYRPFYPFKIRGLFVVLNFARWAILFQIKIVINLPRILKIQTIDQSKIYETRDNKEEFGIYDDFWGSMDTICNYMSELILTYFDFGRKLIGS